MQNITATAQAHTYVRVLRRWWWLPVMFAVLSAGVTYAGTSYLIKPEYGATVSLLVQQPTSGTLTASPVDANEVALDMVSRSVLDLTWNTILGCHGVYACPNWLLATGPQGGNGGSGGGGPGSRHRTHHRSRGTTSAPAFPKLKLASNDYKALWQRTACAADTTDRFVTCTTTSQNYLVPPLILNRLAAVFQKWIVHYIGNNYQSELSSINGTIGSLQKREAKVQAKLQLLPTTSNQFGYWLTVLNGLQGNVQAENDSRNTINQTIYNN
ncbi:MAG TPA: hypothetical protein VG815_03815, partial [Chloroflexota bacterium]|nr:hypothetical protein [Chloroflexota bacterium]